MPFANLPTFLDAVGGKDPADRHAQLVFASIGSFLTALGVPGPPVRLGDWNADGTIDAYESRTLAVDATIELPRVFDTFDIVYENDALDVVGVVYLRATRGVSV